MAELKPCPFCGINPKIDWNSMTLGGYADLELTWKVECPKCGVSKYRRAKYFLKTTGIFEDHDLAYEGLIEEWNRRAK